MRSLVAFTLALFALLILAALPAHATGFGVAAVSGTCNSFGGACGATFGNVGVGAFAVPSYSTVAVSTPVVAAPVITGYSSANFGVVAAPVVTHRVNVGVVATHRAHFGVVAPAHRFSVNVSARHRPGLGNRVRGAVRGFRRGF